MPTKGATIQAAVAEFESAHYPIPTPTAETAWLGIYQVLLWYEKVGVGRRAGFPHVIDADKLRPKRKAKKLGAWQRRAIATEGVSGKLAFLRTPTSLTEYRSTYASSRVLQLATSEFLGHRLSGTRRACSCAVWQPPHHIRYRSGRRKYLSWCYHSGTQHNSAN